MLFLVARMLCCTVLCRQCLPGWGELPFLLAEEACYTPPVSEPGSPAPVLGGGPPEPVDGERAALLRLALAASSSSSASSSASASASSARRPRDGGAQGDVGTQGRDEAGDTSYARALAALDSLPRGQLVATAAAYSRLRGALFARLRPLADRGQVVTAADIRAAFGHGASDAPPAKRARQA